jgi:hypothetical protein
MAVAHHHLSAGPWRWRAQRNPGGAQRRAERGPHEQVI